MFFGSNFTLIFTVNLYASEKQSTYGNFSKIDFSTGIKFIFKSLSVNTINVNT